VLRIHKDQEGNIVGRGPDMYRFWIKLTVLPIEKGEKLSSMDVPPSETFWVVDDSRTKVWQYDNNTVYVPFDNLQRDLGMTAAGDEPARTSEINIKIKPGADLMATRDQVQKIVDQVMAAHDEAITMWPPQAETWEQVNALWLGAIEKEKLLVTFLFGIISIVAIFLIFCIFYMIVAEKTKDIGIIKSIGATSSGVAGIFLGYGLTIGIVGGLLGLAAGYGIVHNINFLHEQMGKLLHVQIWDPEVYAFDTIPNTMNPNEVAVIVSVAVISSVLGALVPAIRAARMDPVDSLRWE
jgi:lipoprotein-releasing system permease protein